AALAAISTHRRGLWVAAFFAVLAAGVKVVYVVAVVGIAGYVWQCRGRREMLRFLIAYGLLGVFSLLLAHWVFGLQPLLEAVAYNPSTHPWVWHPSMDKEEGEYTTL